MLNEINLCAKLQKVNEMSLHTFNYFILQLIYSKIATAIVHPFNIISTFASDYHGVLRDSAEIIPIEPDAASTDEGKLI